MSSACLQEMALAGEYVVTSARGAAGSAEDSLLGRMPPQNLEAEQAVLGCMMLEEDSVGLVVEELSADDFYSSEHRLIFEAMMKLFERGDPIDSLTLR